MSVVYRSQPKHDKDIAGILKYLYDLHKADYDNDLQLFQSVCSVKGTAGCMGWGDPWVTANPYYLGNDIEHSWSSLVQPYIFISYCFVDYYIRITHYAIRSRGKENNDMPKGWIVFGSVDEKNWDVVDEQQNRQELLNINQIHTYNVSRSGIYKYFKLILTENKRSYNVFSYGKIDFFGDLLNGYPNKPNSINIKSDINKVFYSLILLFIQ